MYAYDVSVWGTELATAQSAVDHEKLWNLAMNNDEYLTKSFTGVLGHH